MLGSLGVEYLLLRLGLLRLFAVNQLSPFELRLRSGGLYFFENVINPWLLGGFLLYQKWLGRALYCEWLILRALFTVPLEALDLTHPRR